MRHFIRYNLALLCLPFALAFCFIVASPDQAEAAWSALDPYLVTNDCGVNGENCSGYANTQASFNDNHDQFPEMNNVGDIVWQGKPLDVSDYNYEIYFKSAASGLIEPVTEDSNWDAYPSLNDFGEISWISSPDGESSHVKLSSGGNSSIISPSLMISPSEWYWNDRPIINNKGDVVWVSEDGHDYEINLYSDGTTSQITNNETNDLNPRINDNGDLVWSGLGDLQTDLSYDIYTRIGGGITQVTSDDLDEDYPQISNTGHMVWMSHDGAQWDVIMMGNGETVPTQITTNSGDDALPAINDEGIVTWQGHDGNDWEIFVYSGDTITQLTDNDYYDGQPQINSAGDIAWIAINTDMGIHLYEPDTQTISKLSAQQYGHYNITFDINDQGKVVWAGSDGSDFEIIVAEPSGSIHNDLYIYPETLNLQSQRKVFKAVIDLPLPDSAEYIDPSTVAITMISPEKSMATPLPEPFYCTGEGRVGDSDNNGLIDLTVKFDYQAFVDLVEPMGELGTYKLSIAGNLDDGRLITGDYTIKIVDRKMKKYKKAHPRFEKFKKNGAGNSNRKNSADKKN